MPADYPRPHAAVQALLERTSDFLMQSYQMKDTPLHLRPAMTFITGAWVIMLGILGLAPIPKMPWNDKAQHFFGMGFASFLLYFVIDVPEGPHRRVWYIRRAPLLFTLFCGFFIGGIVSEFVQSALPWKTFQFGDIVANLLGASLFTYIASILAKRSRDRSELASLYTPLSSHASASYRDAQGRLHAFGAAPEPTSNGGSNGASPGVVGAGMAAGAAGGLVGGGAIALAGGEGDDVWDDSVGDGELNTAFALGDDDGDMV